MIQRVQSLWLFLAAMLNGLLFLFPLYRFNMPGLMYSPWQYEGVKNYMPLFIVAAIITLLPLVTIFFYQDRKRQKGMVWLCIIGVIAFIALAMMRIANLKNGSPPVGNFEYVLPGLLVPIAAAVLEFLALRGIQKDEKLVRSMDRLR